MAKRSYSPEQRTEALELYANEGPTAVEQHLGIPKATVASWARRSGVHTVRNERTAAATEARSLDMAQRRQLLAERLQCVAEVATEKELAILKTPFPELRDVVGARTRAIHDVALLTGQATGRTEHITVDAVDREIQALAVELGLSADAAA